MAVMLADLRALPAPALLQVVDYEAARTARLARLVALLRAAGIDYDVAGTDTGSVPIEGDPLVVTEEAGAYRDIYQTERLNETALQLLVGFATGSNLDHLGANVSTPRLAGELDDAYRARIANALERPSTAGSAAGYREHALGVSAAVLDVGVSSPAPGTVRLYVLAQDGPAEDALLAAVLAAVSADDVRPITDAVEVLAAEVVTADIVVTLGLYPGADEGTVRTLADARIRAYVALHYALGHDLTLAGVIAAAMVPGARTAAITLNGVAVDLVLTAAQAPALGTLTLTIPATRDV